MEEWQSKERSTDANRIMNTFLIVKKLPILTFNGVIYDVQQLSLLFR